jgi:NADPH:quinone reductase-like Zn-dependent oxidoreductase
MKAVRFHQHGGLEQLRCEEIDLPTLKPGEAMVQVKACALNHLDLWVRRGMPGQKTPLPLIPGADIAGILVKNPHGISPLREGDAVVISPGVSCGLCSRCLAGQENLCKEYGIIGETRDGGYAEYVALPVQNLLPKPKNLSFEEAAAFPLVFLTAWHMLVTLGEISPGQQVLIHAAGSGIGSAAVQIAKLYRASVIATAGSGEKLEKAREWGADYLINSNEEDFAQRVREITQKRGVDLVFEHIGEKTFEGSYKSLCKGGRLVTCGATSGYDVNLDLRYVFSRQLQILGSTMGGRGELLTLLNLASQDLLKPIVDRTFPLNEAREAQAALEERHHFGKIVLVP